MNYVATMVSNQPLLHSTSAFSSSPPTLTNSVRCSESYGLHQCIRRKAPPLSTLNRALSLAKNAGNENVSYYYRLYLCNRTTHAPYFGIVQPKETITQSCMGRMPRWRSYHFMQDTIGAKFRLSLSVQRGIARQHICLSKREWSRFRELTSAIVGIIHQTQTCAHQAF